MKVGARNQRDEAREWFVKMMRDARRAYDKGRAAGWRDATRLKPAFATERVARILGKSDSSEEISERVARILGKSASSEEISAAHNGYVVGYAAKISMTVELRDKEKTGGEINGPSRNRRCAE